MEDTKNVPAFGDSANQTEQTILSAEPVETATESVQDQSNSVNETSEAAASSTLHQAEKILSESPAIKQKPLKNPLKLAAVCLISILIGGGATAFFLLNLYPGILSPTRPTGASFTPVINTSQNQAVFPVEQIAKDTGPAVVGIINMQSARGLSGKSNLQEAGSGSGFIIDAQNGYIVTNNHVIDGAQKLTVSLSDGRNVDAKVVGADSRTDLAVLKLADTSNLTAVQLGDSSAIAVGQPVVAIGNPGGIEFARSVTTGVISATNRTLNLQGEAGYDLIQTDAAINPGNSGGPLVNYQGLVIGINSAKYAVSGFEGMGFAIPISTALPTIQQLIDTGVAKHPALFVSINDNYSDYAKSNNLPPGAYISDVTANGPAAKAGLIKGDIITKINDIAVQNSSDLVHAVYQYQVGDTVTVSYLRNDQTNQVQITLGEISSDQ